MAKGGAMPGAGRPKGSTSAKNQELLEKVRSTGITPLEYMLKVLRDENESPDRRDDMAKSAAPYIHPKLNAISAPDGGPVQLKLTVSFE